MKTTIKQFITYGLIEPIAIIMLMAFQDLTIMSYWNSFVTPLGVPSITFIQTIGIDVMISILVPGHVDESKPFFDRWFSEIIKTGFAFALGVILYGIMMR